MYMMPMASRPRTRLLRVGCAAFALAGMVLTATACSSGNSDDSSNDGNTLKATPPSSGATSGSGPVTVGNGNGGGAAQGGGGNQGAMGTFTAEFARCMRAHGVANFPDPGSKNNQLGPGSGVDPASAQFQAAVKGPCKSLAPSWLSSSGKVSK